MKKKAVNLVYAWPITVDEVLKAVASLLKIG